MNIYRHCARIFLTSISLLMMLGLLAGCYEPLDKAVVTCLRERGKYYDNLCRKADQCELDTQAISACQYKVQEDRRLANQ